MQAAWCHWQAQWQLLMSKWRIRKGTLGIHRDAAADSSRLEGLGHTLALDIARGLAFLHAMQIIHFDLKTPNGATSSSAVQHTWQCPP